MLFFADRETRIYKLIETKDRMVVAKVWGVGNGKMLVNKYELFGMTQISSRI